MRQSDPNVVYVDQSGVLAGGELNLYDFLRFAPESASVILLEDGPFRLLLEQIGLQVTVLPIGVVEGIRRGAGLLSLIRVLPAFWDLRKRLMQLTSGSDIVYANSQKGFLLSALAWRRGQPIIWHLHDILVADHFSTLLIKAAVFVGNRFATRVIANSESTAAAFVAAGGQADKVRRVYCGLDSEPFDRITSDLIASTRATLCPADTFLVGVFGRLSEWKGQHVLLEAVSTLQGVHVVIVGAPLFGQDAYRARLLERSQQPDLAGRVHFSGFSKNVPELMKSVDLVAHTSISPEPFGRVIVEGMLAGRPVIASNAGGAAEIIIHNKSGILVTPGSSQELREAIDRLRTDMKLCHALAIAGRQRAETFFSLAKMVAGVREVIADVASTL